MTIRVLIVDDSPTMRALLGELLRREADITVIGAAADAAEARTIMREQSPDVVTLDIEMPGMNGLDFLDKVMRLKPTPVIVVSGLTRDGADATVRALEIGAVDCYAKPDGKIGSLLITDDGRLAALIRNAAKAKLRDRAAGPVTIMPRHAVSPLISHHRPALIAVGASTGGVEALQLLLQNFPADCPPTVIVQHINGHFAEAVARRLDQQCAPKVTIAEPDLPLKPGHIYLAPGNDRHVQVRGGATNPCARMRADDKVSGHRPSVDVLFRSVAETMGDKAVGILLTGMGTDGAQGLLAMAHAGATTIAQDEATCTVFGMPKAAIALGAAGLIAPIHRIADHALARAA
ncbi:MAG: chemotaxis response regulator protein-glutamate methylesterase [Sphingomonas sp. 28-62-20]|uniref:protein-glutamate methylesterase/protein-glutamine glutaminase n=1 Tax=Sphingomonas sp. 28-62-20 TaxID=1970433 RepID=UPI000BC6ADDE|nr:MAG: chemotaxis response regulator protein-glutamate methylesterase [Sphingomonas sp. 28-62-20]